MNESRNRPRKVTRKAGPPAEAQETASNEAASPVFQAPDNSATNSAAQKNENSGNSEKSSENKNQGENTNRRNRSRGSRGRGRGGNQGNNNSQSGGNQGGRNNRRGGNNNRRNVPKSMQGADLTKRLPQPPKQAKGSLRIYALGGISEIGRNMTVFEYDGKLLVIDCGVLFPSSGEPGVDLILPDFGPIENKLDKIEALIITHAHEDHIGAIPWLLKLRSDIPIVASRFTIALIAAKCKEHRQRPKFIEVNEKSDVSYGPFRARFWAVNHSVPDALGVMLGTPAGNVIHTGDIKLDQTPLDGRPTDLPALSRYGDEGVDLMLCDSTNANIPGVSASEGDIPATFNRLVAGARQRVIIASFASNVYRVQAAIDAAVNAGRKVAFNGRSMMRNMEIAEKMGFLRVPRGTIVSIEDAAKMAPHKVVLITTGTQGEPMAALSRSARREHRQITVRDGDMIVFSSSLIPGNEEAVYGVMNMLSQIGAEVINNKEAKVHDSGHGYGGELLFLYNAARPNNAMPVHDEWRHFRANQELAICPGVHRDHVVQARNGVDGDLQDGRAQVVGQLTVGHLYVDGVNMGEVDADTLADRTNLGSGGVVSITCVIDNRTSRLLEHPSVATTGFSDDDRGIVPEVAEMVENTMNDLASEGENDTYRMVQRLRRKVSKLMDSKYKREPVILPTIIATSGEVLVADEDDVKATRPSQ